ncbi:MAG: hypothetical protein WCF67_20515 [Chitinophagaceae bacterium]
MKQKIALTLTSLVLASLLSFSNNCGSTCDGRKSYMPSEPTVASSLNSEANDQQEEANSPLLRMAITL